MREVRQILFYRLEKGICAEQTANALKVSKGTVINTIKRFKESGLEWPLADDITDGTLEARLYPAKSHDAKPASHFNLPSLQYVEKELAKKHVTLQCLFDEYQRGTIEPVSRASFFDISIAPAFRRSVCL